MKPSESWQPEPLYMGDDAETAVEIAEKKGMSAQQVRVYAKRFVESGAWKEVTVKRAGKRNSEKAYIVNEKV